MAIGLIQTWAGHGFPTKILDGRRIIMGAGSACAGEVGFGSLGAIGLRPGFPGARVVIMSAGRRSRRGAEETSFTITGPSPHKLTSNSTLGPRITTLSTFATSANQSCESEFSPWTRM